MMNINKTKAGLLASTCLFAMQSHAADEAALYDLAPENSAFVRIVNNEIDKPVSTKIGDKLLLSDGYCQASDYEYVSAGTYTFNLEDKEWSGKLAENKAYTFILNNEHISVIEDAVFNNSKKGLFVVYNLTDIESISVKTKDGKKAIFPDVAGHAHVAREVNPIKIGLAIYHSDLKLVDADTATFQRGKSKNLFVCGSEQTYLANWTIE